MVTTRNKRLKENKMKQKKQPNIKEINYNFKVSLPLSNEKFSAWYTIEYGEVRTLNSAQTLDKQKEELMNIVEQEVINCIDILRENIKSGKMNTTILGSDD
jgi:hypothetical protein